MVLLRNWSAFEPDMTAPGAGLHGSEGKGVGEEPLEMPVDVQFPFHVLLRCVAPVSTCSSNSENGAGSTVEKYVIVQNGVTKHRVKDRPLEGALSEPIVMKVQVQPLNVLRNIEKYPVLAMTNPRHCGTRDFVASVTPPVLQVLVFEGAEEASNR